MKCNRCGKEFEFPNFKKIIFFSTAHDAVTITASYTQDEVYIPICPKCGVPLNSP